MTVGTQAALLAGFAFTGIIEAPWDMFFDMAIHPVIVSVTIVATLLGMIFELLAVVKSVQVSILGPGLALRGSEGSMTRALSVMRHEQRRLHWQFYFGLFFFHIATACFCAAIFDVPTKIVCISCLVCSFGWMVLDCQSVAQKLWLPPAASLWRSEVDRRPSSRRGVRCSCTGALIPQASTPSRPSSLADGASSAPTRLGGQQRVGTPPSGSGGGGGGGVE